jgi:hypothetical protein
MSQKCKKEGCNSWATSDGFCFTHSPLYAEKRLLAQSKGGSVGKDPKDRLSVDLEPINIQNPKEIIVLLSQTIDHVRLGQMDTKIANCIGNLSNYLIRVMELVSLEERINIIEATILNSKK